MMVTSTLLEVKDLNVDHLASSGTVHAVIDVSFSLQRGEILGLAGESGSGKSTLAYAIARLLRPPAAITGGEVLYYPTRRVEEADGASIAAAATSGMPVDVLGLGPAALRTFRWNELAIVFQSAMNALNPVLSVGQQIDDTF